MGDVIQLAGSALLQTSMSAEEVEAACLRTAATLSSVAAEWTMWHRHGIDDAEPLLKVGEALIVDLVRHNRRHLSAKRVCDPKVLQELDRRLRGVLSAVLAVRAKFNV